MVILHGAYKCPQWMDARASRLVLGDLDLAVVDLRAQDENSRATVSDSAQARRFAMAG